MISARLARCIIEIDEEYRVYIARDPASGVVLSEVWCLNDRESRVGGPAGIYRHPDGTIRGEEWKLDGLPHRLNGERCSFWRDQDSGIITHESWRENGRYHRDNDLPAAIVRWESTGCLSQEFWMQHGLRHRDGDKPSYIARSEAGIITRVEFRQRDRLHRQGGPAVIEYDQSGTRIRSAEYHLNGLRVRKPRGIIPQGPS